MPALDISPRQFGMVVSAYALAAGVASFAAAGYADRFDRKKLLLFFYAGFMLGTLLCGLAGSFEVLLGARIVTGLFGAPYGIHSPHILAGNGAINGQMLRIIAETDPLDAAGGKKMDNQV